MTSPLQIGLLGSGFFGTALAHLWSQKGHDVTVYSRSSTVCESLNQKQHHPHCYPEKKLGPLKATEDIEFVCRNKDLLVLAIPIPTIRSYLPVLKPYLAKSFLLNTAKGIENDSLLTVSGLIADILGPNFLNHYANLSGPTFAQELVEEQPSGASLASTNNDLVTKLARSLSLPFFRLYSTDDVIGTEIGGALKNVMAIGVGIADGLGFGLNTRAGFMTRCLHEMTRLGIRLGANPLTFSGLSGIGDLILTCTGDLSRNRQVGLKLGRGENFESIKKGMKSVVEGISTAKSAYQLSLKLNVEMPNTTYIYKILHEAMEPRTALQEILKRELKPEKTGL